MKILIESILVARASGKDNEDEGEDHYFNTLDKQ